MSPRTDASQPIESREELLGFLTRGHRPRSDWKLGLEYEQFVTDCEGRPAPYSGERGVEAILHRLKELTGWQSAEEDGHILALRAPDGRALTLEPGAQLEFNTTPCESLADLQREVVEYFQLLSQVREEFGARFLALGAQPLAGPDEIERIPKSRYDILEPYLDEAGDLGRWMMKATAGIQVNFDHRDAEDAARKLRVAFRLAPLFSALFARSPVAAGRQTGFASWRGHVWTRTDPSHCGIVEACTRDDSTLEDYVAWAAAAPMLFIEREGRFLDLRGRSFEQYRRDGFEGHRATQADWDLHLSTLFPEVRFRPQLEIRSTDSQCTPGTLGLCALVKGLFYDESALASAEQLTAGWSHAERVQALEDSHRFGLQAPAPGGGKLLRHVEAMLDLVRLAPEEQAYLEVLQHWVSDGRSPGENLAHMLETQWNGDLLELVEYARCTPCDQTAG